MLGSIWNNDLWTNQGTVILLVANVILPIPILILAEQRKLLRISQFFITTTPWLLIAGFFLFNFLALKYALRTAGVNFLISYVYLAIGLIYAFRCFQLPDRIARWLGLVSSLIIVEMIAVVIYGLLGMAQYLPYGLPLFWFILVALIALVIWTEAVQKLYKPPVDTSLHKPFQCVECDHKLMSRTPIFVCPACGGNIKPQVSQPSST